MSEWNAMTYEGKDTILRVVRTEAERMFAMADQPEAWYRPTACPGWETRDVVAHIVDTVEGYFAGFDAARGGAPVPDALGLAVMSEKVDEGASALRDIPQAELMARLKADFEKMQGMLAPMSADEWTGFIVTHTYMGPVPAFFYAAGQLMDFGVHSWDMRQGTDMAHGLNGDAADLLVPFMFLIWQNTVKPGMVNETVHHRHPGQHRQERRRLPGVGLAGGPDLRAGRDREPARVHRVRRRQHGADRVRTGQLRHHPGRHGPRPRST